MLLNKIRDYLFGASSAPIRPDVRLGRYSDSFKSKEQVGQLKKSMHLFEEKDYMKAFKAFIDYLRDDDEKNVKILLEDGEQLKFEIYQGSKKIITTATIHEVVAEASVVRVDQLEKQVPLMRRLMELNYGLRYSRFCLKEDVVYLKFDTNVIDGSPDKLYYALKEVATRSDKYDDQLLNEFPSLKPIDNTHITELPEAEKEVKYQYLVNWIKEAMNKVEELESRTSKPELQAAIPYILLNLTYRIDYLIAPEGKLMEHLEEIHKAYFAVNTHSITKKVVRMKEEFEAILKMPKALILKELYRVKATFGVTTVATPAMISTFIQEEVKKISWYNNNQYPNIATTMLEYIAQYVMFYYATPKYSRRLYHLIIKMINADYFEALGFQQTYYNLKKDELDRKAIEVFLKTLREEAVREYQKFNLNSAQLQYSSRITFIISLLKAISILDYSQWET